MSAPTGPSGRPADERGGTALPQREPGASPLAAAGAKAGEAAAPAGRRRAEYMIKRLGVRPARGSWRIAAITAAIVLLAAGGVALASFRAGGHARRAAPSLAPAQRQAVPTQSAPSAPARRAPSASPAHQGHGPAGSLEVVGVGCPSAGDDAITVDNAPASPGWMPAGGGWTGNGCDGSTLWTMDPSGKSERSSLTWKFSPAAGAARCTVAIFVPTQNALGVSDYSVSIGPEAKGRVVADVPVRQGIEAGQWLTLGSFPVSGSPLEITTAPLPGASGPGHHGAIAASAARARCA